MQTIQISPLAYYAKQVLQTRKYGHTYVHVSMRRFGGIEIDGINFYISGFGRSLQSGGHKYKVHATRDGKPVSSKELKGFTK